MKPLSFPDEELSLLVDSEIKLIAMQLGILERIEPRTHLSTFFYSVDDHATHWLTFVRYQGFQNPADNGLHLLGWPKSRYSKRDFALALSAHMRAQNLDIQEAEFFDPPNSEGQTSSRS
jgi:hypothetical protein